MSIWFDQYDLESINALSKGTLLEHLAIRITEIGDDFLRARMPVDQRTIQAEGLLHGGATVALAESLGSVAGAMCIDLKRKICVGVEVNANHLRSIRSGFVEGIAKPLHLGKRTQVWEIDILNPEGKRIAVSRITMAILDRE